MTKEQFFEYMGHHAMGVLASFIAFLGMIMTFELPIQYYMFKMSVMQVGLLFIITGCIVDIWLAQNVPMAKKK